MPLPDSRKSAGEGLVGSPEYWPLKTNQAARQAFVESIIGDEDKYIDEAANMMWDAIDAFVAMISRPRPRHCPGDRHEAGRPETMELALRSPSPDIALISPAAARASTRAALARSGDPRDDRGVGLPCNIPLFSSVCLQIQDTHFRCGVPVVVGLPLAR
jgi:hypothetical protein